MIVRVVQFEISKENHARFRGLEQEILLINREYGAIQSYVLYPTDEENEHGVISIWLEKANLDEMRKASKYQDLLSRVKDLAQNQPTDLVYETTSLLNKY